MVLTFQATIDIIWVGAVSGVLQFSVALFTTLFEPKGAPKGKNPVTLLMLVLRGVLAAIAVFISVMITTISPLAAGIMSAFPAIFSTTMVGLWISQGQAVSAGAAGPMMLGGIAVSVVYLCLSIFL